MRRVTLALAFAMALGVPAAATPASTSDLATTDAVLRWINGYRKKPDLAQVPAIGRDVSALSPHHPDNVVAEVAVIPRVSGGSRKSTIPGRLATSWRSSTRSPLCGLFGLSSEE